MTTRSVMTGGLEQDLQLQVLSGAVPNDMLGQAYIIGAVPRGHDTLFSGDGMVWRINCNDAGANVQLKSRHVKTWDWEVDQANPGAFETVGYARSSAEYGYRSLANTAFLPFQNTRLLVTCDAGRHWEIDPESLEAITPVGYYTEWLWSAPHPVNPLMQSTAHPIQDHETGDCWFAELQMALSPRTAADGFYHSDVYLTRWNGESGLHRWRLNGVHIQMCTHQFMMTEGHIIIVDTNFLVEARQISDPEYAVQVPGYCDLYIVNRADLTPRNEARGVPSLHVRLPVGAIHLSADWRTPGGRITFYLVAPGPSDGSEWLRSNDLEYLSGNPVRPELVGFLPAPSDVSVLGKFVVDAQSGTILEEHLLYDLELTWGSGLYTRNEHLLSSIHTQENLFWAAMGTDPDCLTERIVELYEGFEDRIVPLTELPTSPLPCRLFRLELEVFAIADQYTFPAGRTVTSPVFVPRKGCAHDLDGYVLCVVLSDAADELWLFDAQDLAAGPVCRLGHADLNMPWTIHTSWMAALGPRGSSYQVDRERDASLTAKLVIQKGAQMLRTYGPR